MKNVYFTFFYYKKKVLDQNVNCY